MSSLVRSNQQLHTNLRIHMFRAFPIISLLDNYYSQRNKNLSFLFACLKSIGAHGMHFYSGTCEPETTKESIKTKTESGSVLSKVLSLD